MSSSLNNQENILNIHTIVVKSWTLTIYKKEAWFSEKQYPNSLYREKELVESPNRNKMLGEKTD